MTTASILLTLAVAQAAASHPAPPAAREIAPNTYLLAGATPEDRGPDGNTVLITTPAGVVVIDTGRHPWHSGAIVTFARDRGLPVVAVVNTHWHLDHSSGNRRVKAVYPAAKVYTTRAVERAIAPGGFLARSLATARARQLPPDAPAVRQEERALFFATMEASASLKPDVAIERTAPIELSGRPLSVHVATSAVTDADAWILDEATRVAVVGDLVTLPAPFFETACPAGWQAALDEVWKTPFTMAVPGHGAPMSRAEFDTYRRAFAAFRGCVGSERQADACAEEWTRNAAPLLASDGDRRQATEYARYYVDFLRKDGGASVDCLAR